MLYFPTRIPNWWFGVGHNVVFCHGDTFYADNLIDDLFAVFSDGKKIVCPRDAKEFLVPVLFGEEAFTDLSKQINLDIQDFIASCPDTATIQVPDNYVNLNTPADLEKLKQILQGPFSPSPPPYTSNHSTHPKSK